MIYEWRTQTCIGTVAVDDYLNKMDIEGWTLVHLQSLPPGYDLYCTLLHRRPVEAEREAEHLARYRTP